MVVYTAAANIEDILLSFTLLNKWIAASAAEQPIQNAEI